MRRIILKTVIFVSLQGVAAVAQEREWTFDMTDQDAFLVFGTPNTEDVGISLWCKLGSKAIKIFVAEPNSKLKHGTNVKLTIEAGGKSFTFNGESGENDQIAGLSVEAELKTSDPLLEALQTADFIAVTSVDHVSRFPLMDANIDTLLRQCDR
jgi:hypothetical protein